MKQHHAGAVKRLVAGLLSTAIVVGVSALAVYTPVHTQNCVPSSLKDIRTDKATMFYADFTPSEARFVEMAYPNEAATEDLKLIAATF